MSHVRSKASQVIACTSTEEAWYQESLQLEPDWLDIRKARNLLSDYPDLVLPKTEIRQSL